MKFTIRDLINKLQHNFIISDPFPKHTEYARCRLKMLMDKPREISIWEAFYLGQQDAIKKLEILESKQCTCDNPIWSNEYYEMNVKCLNCCMEEKRNG